MPKTLKEKLRERAIAQYSSLFSGDLVDEVKLREIASRLLDDIAMRDRLTVTDEEKKSIIDEILLESVGFGLVDTLLRDPSITEIMINGTNGIYIEKNGKKVLSDINFASEQQVMHLVYKLLAPTRRRVDETYPYTDVSLKDGSRVNIIIPPLALDGPSITIRKFLKEIRSADDLVSLGTMTKPMSDFLVASIKARANMIFSGATGAGKTTTVNVLSSYIAHDERIITIEDAAELRLSQQHVVRLETRPPSIEGKGEVRIRDLFRNSLRMRPDRIILGEVRGEETLDMLQAICSGHRGALAVLHASSPLDIIYRIETMILTSGVPITIDAIHRQMAAALNLLLQHEQQLDGSRKITHIAQVNGLKDNRVVVEDLFTYEVSGFHDGIVEGRWVTTGVKPAFMHLFEKAGVTLPEDMFKPTEVIIRDRVAKEVL